MQLELESGVGVPPASDMIVRKYTWGLDLAGGVGILPASLQSAGGIGGLLALEAPQTVGDPLKYVYEYDANGNVGQLVDWSAASASSAIAAKYEYDPYGNVTASAGTYADANPIRFSTKYFDAQTGLGYWGYRYCSPSLGRWIGRDPMGDGWGSSLYAYCNNDPIAQVDSVGLQSSQPSSAPHYWPAVLVGGDTAAFDRHWRTPGLLPNPLMVVDYKADMHDGGGTISVNAESHYFWPWYIKWPAWVIGFTPDTMTLHRYAKAEAKIDVQCTCVTGGRCIISANLENGSDSANDGRLSAAVAFSISYVSESVLQVTGQFAAVTSADDTVIVKVSGSVPVGPANVGWEIKLPESSAKFDSMAQWVYSCTGGQKPSLQSP